jgi:ribosomal protein S18 acetylase RimI-like enzyme
MSDVAALLALEQEFFTPDHRISRRSFRRFIISLKSTLLVAEYRERVAGCVLVNYRKNWKAAHLYTIAVDCEFRRCGFGRALLAAAEKAAVRRGWKAMRLEVRKDDPGAVKFYETSGYRHFATRPRFYAGRIDALRFEKPL